MHNHSSPVHILKASAGSGKTYRLVQFYVELCFRNIDDPYYFSKILAITFTNKATIEMQERILDKIKELAEDTENADYYSHLHETLGLSTNLIKEHAIVLQRKMILHYEQISVSTIDTFFQRVLRSFARENGLDTSFRVQLDTQLVIQEAVKNLIYDIDEDHILYSWLDKRLRQTIREGNHFDLEKSLISIATEVYSEEVDHENFTELDYATLEKLYNSLFKQRDELLEKNKVYISRVKSWMESYDFKIEDFSYKKSSFLSALINKEDLDELNFVITSSRLQNVMEDPTKMHTKKSKKADQMHEWYNEELYDHIIEYREFANNAYKFYETFQAIQKDFISFITLHALLPHIKEVRQSNNWMVLADTNRLLMQMMNSMYVPFLYEKIAVDYNHLLIDEFQDTSNFQWLNLRTLVDENVSHGQENLIVGDVKQAIYRFRNGEWNLLHSEVEDYYGETAVTENLEKNWRSDGVIVNFNNHIFNSNHIPAIAEDSIRLLVENKYVLEEDADFREIDDITRIFENSAQELPENSSKKEKGYVEINFIGDPEESESELEFESISKYDENYLAKLYNIFLNLQDNDYSAGDIAILCRRNKEIKNTVKYIELLKSNPEHFPGLNADMLNYINNEALEISNNRYVRYILANFRMMLDPENELHHVELLSIVEEDVNIIKEDSSREDKVKLWRDRQESLEGTSILEISELLLNYIPTDKLDEHAIYLEAFHEEIIKYQSEYGSYLPEFLEWWDAENPSLSLPENLNAIQLMTVHKSKGLEFPVVLMPFANWDLGPGSGHDNIMWTTYNEFNMPINWTNNSLNSEFRNEVLEEIINMRIDTINLMYVSMTRAVNELYVLADSLSGNKAKKRDKENGYYPDNLNELLLDYVESNSDQFNELEVIDGVKTYFIGLQEARDKKASERENRINVPFEKYRSELPPLRMPAWEEDSLRSDSEVVQKVVQGNIIHEILEYMEHEDDMDYALKKACLNGLFSEDEYDKWKITLQKLLEVNEIREIFDEKYEVLNEREIYSASGRRLIPDRVIMDGSRVHIIDYKSGSKQEKHKYQLRRYKEQFEQMGYTQVKTSILYTNSLTLETLS